MDGISFDKLEALYTQMQEKLLSLYKSKTIIFIPIQAIEHWLLYLKERQKNPYSTKNLSFENKDRKQAKKDLYGHDRYNGLTDNDIVEKLSSEMDTDWIASQSASFKHFHAQVSTFMAIVLP